MKFLYANRLLIYTIAVLLSVAAVWIKLLFPDLLGDNAPFLLALFPIIIAALIGGFRPGLVAVGITSVLVAYYFLEPFHSLAVISTASRVGMLVFVIQGVTLSWLIDMQRRAAARSDRLARIVEDSDDAIFSKKLDGTITTWNKGAEKLYGYTEAEIIGQNVAILAPQSKKKEVQSHLDMVNNGASIDHKETVRMNKDGARIRVSLSISPVTNNAGKVIAISTIVRDVSEQYRLTRELKRANSSLEKQVAERTKELREANIELQRSNKELQDFAYVASHDLQEPLRKIQSFGNLLSSESQGSFSEDAKVYVGRMLDAASRMRMLIDDLLSFSRVSSQVRPFQQVNLQIVVEEVIGDLETRIEELGATVTVKDLPVIEADPIQMRQVFQNLISNALKFHKPDIAPVVTLSTKSSRKKKRNNSSSDGLFTIYIKDNGIGLDEKYKDRIFTIFERLHGRQDFEGTGIGLAVVKKIVDRHKGTIRLKSKVGEGTTFILTLPAAQPET